MKKGLHPAALIITFAAVAIVTSLTVSGISISAKAKNAATDMQTPSTPVANAVHVLLPTLKNNTPTSGKWQVEALKKFYRQRDYQSVWLEDDGSWKRDVDPFISAFKQAEKEGLNYADYQFATAVNQARASQSPKALAFSGKMVPIYRRRLIS